MTVRSRSKGDATIATLRGLYHDTALSLVVVDLTRPKDVAKAAIELRTRYALLCTACRPASHRPRVHSNGPPHACQPGFPLTSRVSFAGSSGSMCCTPTRA